MFFRDRCFIVLSHTALDHRCSDYIRQRECRRVDCCRRPPTFLCRDSMDTLSLMARAVLPLCCVFPFFPFDDLVDTHDRELVTPRYLQRSVTSPNRAHDLTIAFGSLFKVHGASCSRFSKQVRHAGRVRFTFGGGHASAMRINFYHRHAMLARLVILASARFLILVL